MKKTEPSVLFKLATLTSTAFVVALTACSSKDKRDPKDYEAKDIETKLEREEKTVSNETLGVKDGKVIVQKKVLMAEELRRLQYDVYGLEDQVYGNRNYGSQGMYGKLKRCRAELTEKKNGGDGKLIWTEPIDRVTEKEEELKIGMDEKDKLVGVSEEYLHDRIDRFKTYQKILRERETEYDTKIAVCETDLKSRKQDQQPANKE